jgi:hypothetical protein
MSLLRRREGKTERRCTPEEQAGPDATKCPACKRKTVHQHTHLCQVPGCKLGEYKAAEVEEIRERVKAGTIPDVVAATLAGVLSDEIQGRKTAHQHTHLCQVPGCALGEYLADALGAGKDGG